jgi:hypothetical protein
MIFVLPDLQSTGLFIRSIKFTNHPGRNDSKNCEKEFSINYRQSKSIDTLDREQSKGSFKETHEFQVPMNLIPLSERFLDKSSIKNARLRCIINENGLSFH